MVLRNMKSIKDLIHGVIHIMMFYNNGIVFQTTFPSEKNIPLIGEKLSLIVNQMQNLMKMYDENELSYKKLIYETDNYIIAIIKLGEESNLALLLDNSPTDSLELKKIKKFIDKLEELIDMDKEELVHENA
ncbi:hypothetical protein NEF87_000576 [Candidatus Lokiarchaeum ossiferum]|uniref:Roadblock/LAMTOR2 domain-containing protein n=1 Tax=Candidatus Lokiarchaeum ossiferum TaxID=2951803 RepID=A0ABY6HLA5_9ARCH|nr:hypothetical protein NEF87_000576 [Candidatus Lokiarchaeum sp. B-35]